MMKHNFSPLLRKIRTRKQIKYKKEDSIYKQSEHGVIGGSCECDFCLDKFYKPKKITDNNIFDISH